MDDPIEKMRRALEEAQDKARLKKFALKCEEVHLEESFKKFVREAVRPALDQVHRDFFMPKQLKMEKLPEGLADPGFKVQDFPDSEFWFWIEVHNGKPEAEARRKRVRSSGATRVVARLYSSKPNFELADVTAEDIVRTIADAYVRSLP